MNAPQDPSGAHPSKRVTLADIGREAGVSFSTVSRVLRKREGRIPEATRKKVMEAAERLGYRRNLLIQGVQTGHSMNIGVIIPSTGSFYSEIVRGIHDTFSDNGYCILLAWNPNDVENVDSDMERDLIHRLVDRRVDGIILRPTHSDVSDVYFSEVLERGIPLVTVDRPLPGVKCGFAGTDDELGARLAARHLLDAGHRNLVHLASMTSFAPGGLRQKGFEEECAAYAGAQVRTVFIDKFGTADPAGQAVENLLSSEDRPTALFLSSDSLAPPVYRACRTLGLEIPGDVSVVGFGNVYKDDMAYPALTSIDQDPHQIGCHAAQMILDQIQKTENPASELLVDPQLISRASVRSV